MKTNVFFVMSLVIVGLFVNNVLGVASDYLSDDFPGEEIDTAKWNVSLDTTGTVTVSDSVLTLAAASGTPWVRVGSKKEYRPTKDLYVVLSMYDVSPYNWNKKAYWGLNADYLSDTVNFIRVRTDLTTNKQYFSMKKNGGTSREIQLASYVGFDDQRDWVFKWTKDRVLLYMNGDLVVDTDVDTPISGSWEIPTVDMGAYFKRGSEQLKCGMVTLEMAAVNYTDENWESIANTNIETYRKRDVEIDVNLSGYGAVAGRNVEIVQVKHEFGFGSAITYEVLQESEPNKETYEDFFRSHFEWATPRNSAKWDSLEPTRDYKSYGGVDMVTEFCTENDINMRGHTLFYSWKDPEWMEDANDVIAWDEILEHIEEEPNYFAGKFKHWDVMNEAVVLNYYDARFGTGTSSDLFVRTRARLNEVDPNCLMFTNENGILVGQRTENYRDLIEAHRDANAFPDAIGIQGHMKKDFPRPVMFAALDSMSNLDSEPNLPIWITEFSVVDSNETNRADCFEDFYRIAFGHPGVEGILMWDFWAGNHTYGADAAIVDVNWNLTEAGERYEAMMAEWTTNTVLKTDANGVVTFRGTHGTYEIRIPTFDPCDSDGYWTTTVTLEPGESTEQWSFDITDIAPVFTEKVTEWTPGNTGWTTKDLSGEVPANAVAEIAIANIAADSLAIGGVRARGSSLNRYASMHEAEDGGRDFVTMTVQVDPNCEIETYADNTDRIRFVLLG
ncbi:MAG: endo-1,4-beta-xylanase, partial [Phycisphaerae bacterium]